MGRRAHIWPRKGSDQFWATIDGRQEPLGSDREEAERKFHLLKAEGKKRKKAGMTLAGFADCFTDFLDREREPRTAEWYTMFLQSFIDHVGRDTPATQIEPRHVSAWLAAHDAWGATTRSHAITAVKRLYSWGKKEGLISTNPIKEVEKPRPKKRETFITDADAARIYAAAFTHASRKFLTALRETGCRPFEIYTLTVDRVDVAGGTWRVLNKTRGMTGEKYRTIYLSPAMIEMSRSLLAKYPDGHLFRNSRSEPWTKGAIVKLFRRIQQRTGMGGGKAVAYAFRHLYVTDALEKGIPPATVAELVGHKSLDMIMKVYSKLKHRTDHLREAAQMIRPAENGDNPTRPA